jgi:hypothetical protein
MQPCVWAAWKQARSRPLQQCWSRSPALCLAWHAARAARCLPVPKAAQCLPAARVAHCRHTAQAAHCRCPGPRAHPLAAACRHCRPAGTAGSGARAAGRRQAQQAQQQQQEQHRAARSRPTQQAAQRPQVKERSSCSSVFRCRWRLRGQSRGLQQAANHPQRQRWPTRQLVARLLAAARLAAEPDYECIKHNQSSALCRRIVPLERLERRPHPCDQPPLVFFKPPAAISNLQPSPLRVTILSHPCDT